MADNKRQQKDIHMKSLQQNGGAALDAMKSSKSNNHFRACQTKGVSFVPLLVGGAMTQFSIIAPLLSSPPSAFPQTDGERQTDRKRQTCRQAERQTVIDRQ